MRGIPGSGKSTWAKNYPTPCFIVSTDKFFIDEKDGEYKFDIEKLGYNHQKAFYQFQGAVNNEVPVIIIDNTNIKRKNYKNYVEFGLSGGYTVVQKVCCGNYQSVHNVPEEKIEQMRHEFQVDETLPHYEENIKTITLNEAREHALHVFEETEKRLQEERLRESNFIISLSTGM